MNQYKHDIDPLQEAFQQRFKDFEIEVDLNMDKILAESKALKPNTSAPRNFVKYYVAGGIMVSSAIAALIYFNSNQTESKSTIIPVPQERTNEMIVPNSLPENNTDTVSINTKEIKIDAVKAIPKTTNSPQKDYSQTPSELIVTKNDTVITIKEHNEVRTANFDDFIKHKAKQSKDSLELFKHKK